MSYRSPARKVFGALFILALITVYMTVVSGCAEKPPDPKIAFYHQKVKEDPGNPVNYTNLGWALYQAGDLPEAVRWNEKALQINSSNSTARYNLALIYFDRQDFARSSQELTTILKSQPEDGLALLKLGEVNLKLNKYEQARQVFKAYLKQDITSATALKGLGDCYTGLGQLEKAKAAYTLAIKYVPQYKEAQKALTALEEKKHE